jgi:hypothetical protein
MENCLTEKRKHRRSSIQLDVDLVYPEGGSSRVKTRDLSIGGLFVEAIDNQPPKLGTLLTVTFLSTPHQSGTYSLKARVQRLTHNGIAMTFIDFDLEDLRFIDTILSGPS